ncbi:MAG: F0F1 ATP synthase subunit B family protein [Alphaproteobacteria bacterium]
MTILASFSPSDPTFWVMIAFFIFGGILFWKKIPGMIAKALDERADKIRAQLEEARTLKEEGQTLLAQYQRKHRDAEKDAEAMIAQAKEEAENFAREAEKNLEVAFRRQTRATEEKISQAETQAVKEVKAAAVEAAVKAASSVLQTNLKAGKHKKLVDEAIKDLDKRLN